MKINNINPTNSQNFKAVNKKYFEWAKKDYECCKDVSSDWLQRLSFDVFLFKEMSPKDGLDTVNAVKKYMDKTDEAIEDLLNSLKKAIR